MNDQAPISKPEMNPDLRAVGITEAQAKRAAEMAIPTEIPQYNDIVYGNAKPRVGEIDISQGMIDRARQGEPKAQDYIANLIQTATGKRELLTGEGVTVGFTKFDESGQLRAMTKDELAEIGISGQAPSGIGFGPFSPTVDVAEEVQRFANSGIRLNELLSNRDIDGRVRQILIDMYGRGSPTREAGRSLRNDLEYLGSFAQDAAVLGVAGFASAVEAAVLDSEETNYFTALKKIYNETYRPAAIKKLAELRGSVDYKKYSEIVEADVRKEFIARHKEGPLNDLVKLKLPNGTIVNGTLLDEEIGNALLDYGMNELTSFEKFQKFVAENFVFTAGVGFTTTLTSAAKFKNLKTAMKNNPALYASDDLNANYRLFKHENARTAVGKKVQGFKDFVADKVGYRGPLNNIQETQRYRGALKSLNEQVREQQSKLDELIMNGSDDAIRAQKAVVKSLRGRRNRFAARGFGYSPYAVAVGKDEVLLSVAQTTGYELFDAAGLNADLGGLAGVLTGALAGKPIAGLISGTAGTVGAVTGIDAVAFDAIKMLDNMGNIMQSKPGLLTGFLRNADFDFIEASSGVVLSAKEKSAFKELANMMRNIDEKDRETVFNSIQNFYDLKGRLLAGVDEADRAAADEMLTKSFASIASIGVLRGYESVNNLTQIKDFREAIKVSREEKRMLDAAELNLNNLASLVAKNQGIDLKDRKYFAQFTENVKSAVARQQGTVAEKLARHGTLIEEWKQGILNNPLHEIQTDKLFDDFYEIKLLLDPERASTLEGKQQMVEESFNELADLMGQRFDNLRQLKGFDGQRRKLGLDLEATKEAFDEYKAAKVRLFYDEAGKVAGDRKVDLFPVLNDLTSKLQGFREKDLKGLFDKSRGVLSGQHGGILYKALAGMGERNVRELFGGMDNAQIKEILENTDPNNPFSLVGEMDVSAIDVEDMPFFEIATALMSKKQANPDLFADDFNLFQADVFETDMVRRHFNNKGAYAKDATEASAFFDVVGSVDEAFKQIPELGAAMERARANYKDLIPDAQRKGTLGEKISKAQTGPSFTNVPEGTYRNPYGKGMNPDEWHEAVANNMLGFLNGTKNEGEIMADIDEFIRYWSDDFSKADGDFFFDLTTEEGNAKYNLVSKILGMTLESAYAMRMKKGAGMDVQNIGLGTKGTPTDVSGYSFDMVDNIKDLQRIIDGRMRVKTAEGKIESRPLIDLSKIASDAQDFYQILGVNNKLKTDLKIFTDAVKNEASEMQAVVGKTADDIAENLEQKDLARLMDVGNPGDFFERYVLAKDPSALVDLKAQYMKGLAPNSPAAQVASQEWDETVQYFLINGVLEYARLGPQQINSFGRKAGQVAETLESPENILKVLNDKNTIQAFQNAGIDSKITQNLLDIAEYALIEEGAKTFRMAGGVRPISPNEMISRAFNVARGMVSPTYVAAEFAFRLMERNNMSILKVAAESGEAGEIILKMMKNPEEITPTEIKTFGTLAKSVLVREYARGNIPQLDLFQPAEDEIRQERARASNFLSE